jgi:hypothetical protein
VITQTDKQNQEQTGKQNQVKTNKANSPSESAQAAVHSGRARGAANDKDGNGGAAQGVDLEEQAGDHALHRLGSVSLAAGRQRLDFVQQDDGGGVVLGLFEPLLQLFLLLVHPHDLGTVAHHLVVFGEVGLVWLVGWCLWRKSEKKLGV